MKKNLFEKSLKTISTILILFAITILVTWGFEIQNTNTTTKKITEQSEIQTNEEKNTISVNFDNLLKINNSTIGWLNISNTNINYPIVQAKDNSYYLSHNFYNEKNSAGWLFADYRNNFDILDQNTIIYGHNRIEGTMFGTLKNLLNESWYTQEQTIYFNTLNYQMTFQIFSIYTIKAQDYIPLTSFTDNELNFFIKQALSKSIYNFNIEIDKNDKFLTLYTCAKGNKERIIIHSKLIEQND